MSKKKLIIKKNKIILEDVQEDFGELMNVTGIKAVTDLAGDTAKFLGNFAKLVVKIGWAGIRYKIFKTIDLKDLKRELNEKNLDFKRDTDRNISNMNSSTESLLRAAGYGESFNKLLNVGMPGMAVLDILGKANLDDLFRTRGNIKDDIKVDIKNFSSGISQYMFKLISKDETDILKLKVPSTLRQNIIDWISKNIHQDFYARIDAIIKSEDDKKFQKLQQFVYKLSEGYRVDAIKEGDISAIISFIIKQIAESKIMESSITLFIRDNKLLLEISDSNSQRSLHTLCKFFAIIILYSDDVIRKTVFANIIGDLKEITVNDENALHQKLSEMFFDSVSMFCQAEFVAKIVKNLEENKTTESIADFLNDSWKNYFGKKEGIIHEDTLADSRQFFIEYRKSIEAIQNNEKAKNKDHAIGICEEILKNIADYINQDMNSKNWEEYANLVENKINKEYLTKSVRELLDILKSKDYSIQTLNNKCKEISIKLENQKNKKGVPEEVEPEEAEPKKAEPKKAERRKKV